jgi:hypothetical protein
MISAIFSADLEEHHKGSENIFEWIFENGESLLVDEDGYLSCLRQNYKYKPELYEHEQRWTDF